MKAWLTNDAAVCRIYRRRRRIKAFLALALAAFLALLAGIVVLLNMTQWETLDISKITNVDQSLILYDKADRECAVLHASEDRIWKPLDEIPKHTRDAFVSAEDARFYEHFGVDIVRIFGAAWADLKAGAYVQGASTISQQLIKLSHLTSEKRMQRKLEEAVLAYRLERVYEKDEILEMYLNYVYFGGGYYGVEAAARGYFGVTASDLSIAQSALLAGILKSPSRFAPHLDLEASTGRRGVILDLMEEYGYLNAEQCAQAKKEAVVLADGAGRNKRGYFVDLALTEACSILHLDMDALLTGGYILYTTADAEAQRILDETFADERAFPKAVNGVQAEAAVAVVDVKSGGIAAIRGGRNDETALAFNRAVRIRRQPGSVIKPILVYAPALETGYTAATMLLDEEMDFDGYRPGNSNDRYAGWVTMREAVTRSLNIPAVAVMERVGVETCKTFAKRLDIEFDARDKSLALALGGFTYGVSPLQIASAYAAFGNGGVYNAPYSIRKICARDGTTLYTHEADGTRVMGGENAYVLTSMLESAVESGTGQRLGALEIPLAGKTGTTGDDNGNRDAWMAAYNPAYAAAVWMGYDDNTLSYLPETVTGGTYPALLLKRLFGALYAEREAPDFEIPPGVRVYRIDARTLQNEHAAVLANALTPDTESYAEVFVSGTEPDAMTSYWLVPAPPSRLTATASEKLALIYFETPSRYMLYRLYRENEEGKSVLVGEFSGETGSVAFTDESIKHNGLYSYYVVPVHPQLVVAGQMMTGEASERATVRIGG